MAAFDLKLGAKYFIHDEEFHLILVRKGKGDELRERALYGLKIETEIASVNFGLEMDLAKQRGYRYEAPDDAFLAMQAKVEKRYVKRGFLPLNVFIASHDLTSDTLVVAGVLRYLDRKNPERIANIVVGEKAKDLLLMSIRWQLTMVKPRMEEKLLERC
jgi:hypothetical protein